MDKSSMYDTLLNLPLFQGVSRECITHTVGRSKFHFLKYAPGETLILSGELCTHIKFVLSGTVKTILSEKSGKLSVEQEFNGPEVIMPSFLFGRDIAYPCEVTAVTPVSMLQIEKGEYLDILSSDSVFLLNYLNYLSVNSQKALSGALNSSDGNSTKRVLYRMLSLTQASAKSIIIRSQGENLNECFGEPAERFERILENLKNDGLLDYERNVIEIKDRRGLEDYFKNSLF